MDGFAEDLTARYKFVHFIRLGEDAHEHGDPWKYGVCCCSNDGVNAILLGFSGTVTMEIARTAIRLAKELNYKNVYWERRRPDGFHRVDVP